jgi:hypothetical protein
MVEVERFAESPVGFRPLTAEMDEQCVQARLHNRTSWKSGLHTLIQAAPRAGIRNRMKIRPISMAPARAFIRDASATRFFVPQGFPFLP